MPSERNTNNYLGMFGLCVTRRSQRQSAQLLLCPQAEHIANAYVSAIRSALTLETVRRSMRLEQRTLNRHGQGRGLDNLDTAFSSRVFVSRSRRAGRRGDVRYWKTAENIRGVG